jgi:hypothetical protein
VDEPRAADLTQAAEPGELEDAEPGFSEAARTGALPVAASTDAAAFPVVGGINGSTRSWQVRA